MLNETMPITAEWQCDNMPPLKILPLTIHLPQLGVVRLGDLGCSNAARALLHLMRWGATKTRLSTEAWWTANEVHAAGAATPASGVKSLQWRSCTAKSYAVTLPSIYYSR